MNSFIQALDKISYNDDSFLQTQNFNGEYLIIPIEEDGYVIEIQGLSKYFFELILEQSSVKSVLDLIEELSAKYEISESKIVRDANSFVADLLSQKVLVDKRT